MKTNITLKLDADLLREARVIAAEEGQSISALLTDRFESLVRERKAIDRSSKRRTSRRLPNLLLGRSDRPCRASGGFEVLYSEDLSHGQWYGSAMIVNPFLTPPR
jgi:hypothetical protein